MNPEPGSSHALIAVVAGILGALITYIVAVVTLRDKIRAEISKKVNTIYEHCDACRNECNEVRNMKDKELKSELRAGEIQFTYIRLLLEDVICEKLEIPRERIERIQKISGVNQVNQLRNKGSL